MAMAISAALTNFQVAAFVANLLFTVFLLSSGELLSKVIKVFSGKDLKF